MNLMTQEAFMTEITKLGFTQESMFAFFEKKMAMLEKYKGKFIESVTSQFKFYLNKETRMSTEMRNEAIRIMQE
jgi:hypothetical protein